MSSQKKSIFLIPGLEKRLLGLIFGGALHTITVHDLFKQIAKEFSAPLKESNIPFSEKIFSAQVDEIVWNKDILASFNDLLRYGGQDGLKHFSQMHSHIPQSFIKKKRLECKGVSRSVQGIYQNIQAGVSRVTYNLKAQKDKVLPEATRQNPLVIPVRDKKSWRIPMPNGLHIGLKHNRVIEENPLRCVFEKARESNADAVIITGGLLFLNTRKTSGNRRTHMERLSGSEFNPNVVHPLYRERAIKIKEMRSSGIIKQKDLEDVMVYVTLAERFLDLLGGLKQIALRPNGIPEYEGQVLIVFGPLEEELIESAALGEYGFATKMRQFQIQGEILALQRTLSPKSYITSAQRTINQQRLETLLDERRRTFVSNVESEEVQWYVKKMRSFFIEKFEEAIPNSKVVGLGSVFVSCGDKVIALPQDRSASVSDGVLSEYILKSAGREALAGTLPDAVVLCSPHSLGHRSAMVQKSSGSIPVKSEAIPVWQLPTLLDKEFLGKAFKDIVRNMHPIEKLVQHELFEPGCSTLVCSDGVLNMEFSSLSHLKNTIAIRKASGKGVGYFRNVQKYLYFLIDTDPHWGHPWKTFYKDDRSNLYRGTTAAIMEMMRRGGLFEGKGFKMPIHGFFQLDDMHQGENFPNHRQPHEQRLSYLQMEQRLNAIVGEARAMRRPEEVIAKLEEAREVTLKQRKLAGEYWLQYQMRAYYEEFLDPNIDFFSALLLRNKNSGVVYRGVSHYIGEEWDTRDIGAITNGSGNHTEGTLDGHMTDGFGPTMYLRAKLSGLPLLRDIPVSDMVKNPLSGNTHIGLGTVQAGDDGYVWALSLRSNPARKSGMGDPLRNALKNAFMRGDFALFFMTLFVIHLSGDIHRYGDIIAHNLWMISCASGTVSDPYLHRGFSLNNTGNLVFGVPVGGPGTAPFRLIYLRHDWIEKNMNNPEGIDFSLILRNPF